MSKDGTNYVDRQKKGGRFCAVPRRLLNILRINFFFLSFPNDAPLYTRLTTIIRLIMRKGISMSLLFYFFYKKRNQGTWPSFLIV